LEDVGHDKLDFLIIEFPSGRIAMVDINNSRVLDDDTAAELAESYGYKTSYNIWKNLGLKYEKTREYEQQYLTDPVSFYTARYGGNKAIFRFIATHPDMDHLTGLYRLSQEVSILNFWDSSPLYSSVELKSSIKTSFQKD
jgi:ribonuclease BN (tRNA processing enzyme)